MGRGWAGRNLEPILKGGVFTKKGGTLSLKSQKVGGSGERKIARLPKRGGGEKQYDTALAFWKKRGKHNNEEEIDFSRKPQFSGEKDEVPGKKSIEEKKGPTKSPRRADRGGFEPEERFVPPQKKME